jgi:hypothetical protein
LNVAQRSTEYVHGPLYICEQRSLVEIQTPTHWNLIGRHMTAPLPVLLPSSILTHPAAQCAYMHVRKNYVHVSKMLLFNFLIFICVILKLFNLKQQKSVDVFRFKN